MHSLSLSSVNSVWIAHVSLQPIKGQGARLLSWKLAYDLSTKLLLKRRGCSAQGGSVSPMEAQLPQNAPILLKAALQCDLAWVVWHTQ